MNKILCPLCISKAKQIFIKDKVPYFACPSCSFRFSLPDRNPNFETTYDELEDNYKEYLKKQSKEKNTFKRYLKWIESFVALRENLNILEIGCGSGAFFSFIEQNRSIKITGLEPSKSIYSVFNLNSKNIFCKTLEEFAETEYEHFDVVIFFEVLEHLDNIPEFFCNLEKVTKKDSYIFFSIPVSDSFIARIMGKYWHQYQKYHLSFFNKKSLSTYLENSPFRILDSRSISRTISLNYLLSYFLNFILKSDKKIHLGKNVYFPFNIFDLSWVALKRGR